jgi:DNA-binding GntR family transcriptional regulator
MRRQGNKVSRARRDRRAPSLEIGENWQQAGAHRRRRVHPSKGKNAAVHLPALPSRGRGPRMMLALSRDVVTPLPEAASPTESQLALDRLQAIVRRVISKGDDHPSLVVQIASKVGAEILYGQRERGSDVNSVELARQFKTSRTPAREAISILVKEGLVEMPPRRRPRVAIMTLDDIKELYGVRAAIAGMVAAEAAVKASDAELETLRGFIPQIEQAVADNDGERFYWINVGFHEYMTQLAHNATLQRILETLTLRSLLLKRIVVSQPGRLARSARDHIYLAEALLARDPDLAASLAKSNVLDGRKILETYFGQDNAGGDAAAAAPAPAPAQ